MNHDFFSPTPRDPFEGDPDDPTSFLGPDESFAPLTDQERREIPEGLVAVCPFRTILSPGGLLGVYMLCEDCGDKHFYNWGVLENHYLVFLSGQASPAREPQFDPDPSCYVPWDYYAGFADGLRSRRPGRF